MIKTIDRSQAMESSDRSLLPIAGVADSKVTTTSDDEAVMQSRSATVATDITIKRRRKLRPTPNLVKRLSLSTSTEKLHGEGRVEAPSKLTTSAATQENEFPYVSDGGEGRYTGDSNSFASLAASESDDEDEQLESLTKSIRQLQQSVLAIKAKQMARRERERMHELQRSQEKQQSQQQQTLPPLPTNSQQQQPRHSNNSRISCKNNS